MRSLACDPDSGCACGGIPDDCLAGNRGSENRPCDYLEGSWPEHRSSIRTRNAEHARTAGRIVRSWRDRRGVSQLALAMEACISQKHLGFIESGRAVPWRDMVVHLAGVLDMPLRERNALLLAAGYAPLYQDRSLTDPAMAHARAEVERVLKAHEPFPALAVDPALEHRRRQRFSDAASGRSRSRRSFPMMRPPRRRCAKVRPRCGWRAS